MKTFKELGLNHELLQGISDLGFINPSPIQEKAIPFILKSSNLNKKGDLVALAQTGTGKTAAFALPILQQLNIEKKNPEAIIICPTRELSLQISQDVKKYAKYLPSISITSVYGGESINMQIKNIKKGTNIIVGTPGRIHDLLRRKTLNLQAIKWLVLDEADEMLDMGFKEDLDAILSETPKQKRTLLFSATMSKNVYQIAKQYMNAEKEISVGTKNSGAKNVTHEYFVINAKDRFEALKRILDYLSDVYGILFCRTRAETQLVADKLKSFGYDAEAIHGEISQNMRTKIMNRFKNKKIRLLVATDVAARGIDVNDLTHVINYNLPDQNEAYTHRTGRTGRAQKSGVAVSLLTSKETRKIAELEKIIGKEFLYKKIPGIAEVWQKQIDNYLDQIENADIKSLDNKTYMEKAIKRLNKIHKDDLIRLFLADRFPDIKTNHKESRDLNAQLRLKKNNQDNKKKTTLRINFGKVHGLDVKGLFRLVNSNKKIKGVEIGRIDLKSNYSLFAVDTFYADMVINNLKARNFKGKKIIITKNKNISNFSNSKKRKSNNSHRKRYK